MRFRKWPKPVAYEETARKRAAFLAKQRREREALPLFDAQIAAGQHSVDEEMARRAIWWPEQQQDGRDQRAARWRDARARLFAFDDEARRLIRGMWRTCPYPADPASFADLLHQVAVGKIDPRQPPWTIRPAVKARVTLRPKSFDEAFRQIGRRKVGGGPKTTEGDELLFCGNLGTGILFLRSRVRLADPTENFLTSSNHRLRDSHVGSAGRWIDIEVTGQITDDQLGRIRRLAEAADVRPVRVRRAHRKLPMKCGRREGERR